MLLAYANTQRGGAQSLGPQKDIHTGKPKGPRVSGRGADRSRNKEMVARRVQLILPNTVSLTCD